ncbi:MAG: transposase [Deltaproteobacteria bacterium]|nr:transposase [Deltaproteobacteria bacterium]
MERGRRKTFRPLDTKRPVHIVMRSSRARGSWSLLSLAHKKSIDSIVYKFAHRFRVRVMHFENVGNHVHLLVRASRRGDFQSFMRTVPAQIATRVTGAKKGKAVAPRTEGVNLAGRNAAGEHGHASDVKRKFWDSLAYSRVVNWGKDLLGLHHYFTKNAFEGEGIELLTANGTVRRFFIRNGRLTI